MNPEAREESRRLAKSIAAYMEKRHGWTPPPLDKMQLNPNAAAIFDFDLDNPKQEKP